MQSDPSEPLSHTPGHKQALRRESRLARRHFVAGLVPGLRRSLERALAKQIRPALASGRTLASYAAMGAEIDPAAIEDAAQAHGLQLVFPRVAGDRLDFHTCARADLIAGHQGIPEPPAHTPRLRPGILLVPLLAIDPAGHRLGQGGGFYDRALQQLRQQGPVFAIGVGWDMQLVDAVPAEGFDQPLDALVTPTLFRWLPGGVKQKS